jgi:2-oxoglutarate dehydrogenase E1 component
MELRQKFLCDVFIDLNCYRKYGHNETDEPAFTQPLEYQLIRQKKPIREIYRDDLIQQGVLEKYMAESLEEEFKKALQQALKGIKASTKAIQPPVVQPEKEPEAIQHVQTGVPLETLQHIGECIAFIPEGFTVHPKLAILGQERLAMLREGPGARPIDWGMGELLAYGSLLWEGVHVRLSGQDSCRGTFSHRHALLMDQAKEQEYVPLKHLKLGQGRFDIYNSPLSEYAVLAFEYGYSTANLKALVLWEAQFGDFSNGAQVVIDQFIAPGEQKWMQKCSLVLLLPHGYEGQGPEHSSGRIERFLALAAENNMRITYPTTPAQLFHLLRGQVMQSARKPLIIFTPKGLLRHPACVSRVSDFTQGTFQEVLDDPSPPQPVKKTRKLVFCSGKIYYDLIAERTKAAADDMAIIRLEMLYPLNLETIRGVIEKYKGFKEFYWVQEEPENMGAWNYVRPILKSLLPKEVALIYVGRQRSAASAVGSHTVHKKEQAAMMNALFGKKEPSIFEIAGQIKA